MSTESSSNGPADELAKRADELSQQADDLTRQADQFARQAQETAPGLLAEFWDFLIHNKKWWLTPIILVLLGFAVLLILGGSAATAPFIYTIY